MITQPVQTTSPTIEQFAAYQAAYDYLNRVLFNNQLSPCLLNFSRHANTCGFFSYKRWHNNSGKHIHEISLNPDLLERPIEEVMSTLVHEMVHQWQFDFGKPSANGYHNKEWAGEMESIGLKPSSTGLPRGKRTGYKMSHYIIQGGKFDIAFQKIPVDYLIPWKGKDYQRKSSKRQTSQGKDKLKYSCPKCLINVWGKTGLNILCGNCHVALNF